MCQICSKNLKHHRGSMVHYTLMLVERSSSGLNNPFANPVCRHAYTCWQITYQQRQISPPTHISLQVSKPHHVYIYDERTWQLQEGSFLQWIKPIEVFDFVERSYVFKALVHKTCMPCT